MCSLVNLADGTNRIGGTLLVVPHTCELDLLKSTSSRWWTGAAHIRSSICRFRQADIPVHTCSTATIGYRQLTRANCNRQLQLLMLDDSPISPRPIPPPPPPSALLPCSSSRSRRVPLVTSSRTKPSTSPRRPSRSAKSLLVAFRSLPRLPSPRSSPLVSEASPFDAEPLDLEPQK